MSGKRRWDAPPPSAPALPPSDDPKIAAVAKIQAQLADKGLKFALKDGPSREIEINDHPHRFLLTKGALHEEVKRLSGALVTTKGIYVPNKAANKIDRPLYLLIQASNMEQVDQAADWLQKVMSGQIIPEAAAGMREFSQQPSGGGGAALTSLGFDAKVFVGIEHNEAQAAGFSLIGKLFGQGGSFLKHIASNTGNSRVLLRGRYPSSGSSEGRNYAEEPLHIAISAPTQQQVDTAKGLAESLIEHVRKEWNEHRDRKTMRHGPGTGYRGPGPDAYRGPPATEMPSATQPQQMDPYYAQYYMQQLYAYDPNAYYGYAAQYQQQYAAAAGGVMPPTDQQQQQQLQQQYQQPQAPASTTAPITSAADAPDVGPARPTAAELAHSHTALPEAPPAPPSHDHDHDQEPEKEEDQSAAKTAGGDDDVSPAKRQAVENKAAGGARPFWAAQNESAPSPLLRK